MSFTFKLTDVLHYTFRHGSKIPNMAETDSRQMLRLLSDHSKSPNVASTFKEYSDTSNENCVQIHG
jgi:hypothetical protein